MTVPANTFQTYQAVGNREDLEDNIYNVDPIETPVASTLERGSAEAVYHEWQLDSLAPAATNAAVEGDDATILAVTPTVRVGNYCQIFTKTVSVSGTQQAVKSAGRADDLAYQLEKRAKEIKRDIEYAITGNQTPSNGNATTARMLRPMCSWYQTNAFRGTGGANGSSTAAATDGTTRSLTEAFFKQAIAAAWTAGGSPNTAIVGSSNKQNISAFSGNVTRQDKAEDDKLHAAFSVYGSDFGDIKIVPDRFSRSRDVHLIQPDMWELATLRPMDLMELAKTGDSDKREFVTELTLVCRNEKANAIIADLA